MPAGHEENDWAYHYVMRFMEQHCGRSVSVDELLADLAFDSLDLVQFQMAVGDEFDLDSSEPSQRLETVRDLIQWVRRRRGG